MNSINLISSALALGAMMGISGTHFQQVKTMVERGAPPQVIPVMEGSDDATLAVSDRLPVPLASTSPVTMKSTGLKITPVSTQTTTRQSIPKGDRDSALMEMLIAIRKDNAHLRNQLANTNRNMDELTFRVDAQSDQFKPLQTDPNARPRAMVVPDDEFIRPMESGDLLPPKY